MDSTGSLGSAFTGIVGYGILNDLDREWRVPRYTNLADSEIDDVEAS